MGCWVLDIAQTPWKGGEVIENKIRYWVLVAAAAWLGCSGAPGSPSRDHDITPGDMRARISFLAADRLQGRATPSQGLDIAASYIQTEFRRMGLKARSSRTSNPPP